MAAPLDSSGLRDALVILGAAGIVIPAFARFRVSPIIGFILVGVLVGPGGLGALTDEAPWLGVFTISDRDTIAPFAEFGIILLLFAIGMELSFKRLWSMRRQVFGIGAAELTGCALVIGLGLFLLGESLTGSVGLGLALSLSSTALVLPLAGTTGPVGRAALAMLLFEDLAIVPIIFLLGAMAPAAGENALEGLATTLALGAVTVAIMLIAGRFLLPRLFAQAARTKSPELFLAVSLLVVIAAALATAAAGLSPIVGALVAGILIAETDYRDEVEVITAPFRGLALGIFLITVGMSVDVAVVLANWQALLLALAGVVAVKALVTSLLLRLSGAGRGVAAEIGLLMASPSETTLIVLATAAAARLITPETAAFWQIVTALGLTITPLLAKLGRDTARRVGLPAETDAAERDTSPATIVIGFGRVGRLIADMLRAHDRPFVAVESDIDTVTLARAEGYPVLFGDVSRPEFVDKLNLGHAAALVLTMDSPVLAVKLTRRIRAYCPRLTIVARARDADHAAALYRAGVTDAVPETLESSLQLSEAVLVDLGIAMGPVIASIHEKRAEMRAQIMAEGETEREPPLRRRTVRERMAKVPSPLVGEGGP